MVGKDGGKIESFVKTFFCFSNSRFAQIKTMFSLKWKGYRYFCKKEIERDLVTVILFYFCVGLIRYFIV